MLDITNRIINVMNIYRNYCNFFCRTGILIQIVNLISTLYCMLIINTIVPEFSLYIFILGSFFFVIGLIYNHSLYILNNELEQIEDEFEELKKT